MPAVTVIPDRSVILCVLTTNFSLENVPALVRSTRWKVYSVSTASPLIFVLVISKGLGIPPALLPFLKRVKVRRSAVASSMGSHSRTSDVWVAFRHLRTGGEGDRSPYVRRMVSWRVENAFCAEASAAKLRETVMSTIEPEVMLGGRRIEGNSI
jgi:hypothetical protein